MRLEHRLLWSRSSDANGDGNLLAARLSGILAAASWARPPPGSQKAFVRQGWLHEPARFRERGEGLNERFLVQNRERKIRDLGSMTGGRMGLSPCRRGWSLNGRRSRSG